MKRKFSPVALALGLASSRSLNLALSTATSLLFTINLSQAASPPAIQTSGSQIVNGGGAVIDGGAGSGYFIQGGTLTINDATLTNFKTVGGAGSGGGAGMGGAVFINSGASVTLNNVNFLNNSALGGNANGGNFGGTLNGILGTVGVGGGAGYTPIQTEFTDIEGTTGTKGNPALLNLGGIGGTGGAGGAGGNGGEKNVGMILDISATSADLAGLVAEGIGAFANPFTVSIGVGIVAQTVSVGINLGNQITALVSWDKSLSDGQIGLGGAGASGGLGGGGGFGFGGGLGGAGGAGGNGGKNWSGSAYKGGAAGGDGGDGGGGGFGGFGAGGGRGGNGGIGGTGATVSATVAVAAVPDTYKTVDAPAVYKQTYVDPVSGLTVIYKDNQDSNISSSDTANFDHDNNPSTPGVALTTSISRPAGPVQIIDVPGTPAIAASSGGTRPNGSTGSGGEGGGGGFGGGGGASGNGNAAKAAGGNGGDGYGGSIFVRQGGTLTITGNATFGGNGVRGGSGEAASATTAKGMTGIAAGTDLFMMTGSTVILNPGSGNVITFNPSVVGSIADDSAASLIPSGGTSPIPSGSGAGLTVASGLVIFRGANLYSGETTLTGGVLQAQDGEGIYVDSRINFAGGVLQSNGDFTRYVGLAPDQVKWTGSGGFAAVNGDLNVSLNDGIGQALAKQTWGLSNFVPTGSALLFGSTSATGKVTFLNNIDLNGANRAIKVMANAADTDHAILSGVLSNGSLTIGDGAHKGTLVLSADNTYTGATQVSGGTLVLEGSLASTSVTVDAGTTLADINAGLTDLTVATINGTLSLSVSETIKTLDGSGSVVLGANRLTVSDGTFSGVISGTGGGLTKVSGGLLTLSGANTYAGSTLINEGSLTLTGSLVSDVVTIASGATLTNSAGGLSVLTALTNNGTLNQDADDTVASLVNTGTIHGSSTLTATTYALNDGSIVHANLGTGTVTAKGAVALNGSSSAATFNVVTGTTTLGSAERLLDTTDLTISSGATLKLGGLEKIGSLFGAGSLDNNSFRLTADDGTFSGVISGSGGLTKVSGGLLTLSGANTYTGSTQINEGALTLSGSLVSDVVTIALGATLTNSNGGLSALTALTNNGTLNQNSDDTVASLVNTGIINGSFTLTATTYALNGGSIVHANLGTGTVTAKGAVALNGTSSAATFNVETGTTTLGSAERLLDTTDLTISSGATLKLGGLEKIGSLFGAGSLNNMGFRLTADDGSFSGAISGSGGLTKVSGGLLTLSGANTYAGSTLINAGSLTLSGSLVSDVVTIALGATLTNSNGGLTALTALTNNGTLNQNSDDTVASLVNTGTINGGFTLTATTYALNGGSVVHANLGAGTVTANDTVALNGTSSAATFNVVTGTTTLGSAERLLDTTDLTISSGATLKLGGLEKIGSLFGAGSLDNNSFRLTADDGTFSGVISGSGGLTKVSGGLLTLSGANTYAGSTLINAGTLTLSGSLISNAVSVASGAFLNDSAGGLASDTTLTANGTVNLTADEQIEKLLGSGLVNITDSVFTINQGAFSGILSGNGDLIKDSAGLLTLSGENDYTGSTRVKAGTLTLDGSLVSAQVTVDLGATANVTDGGLASDTVLTANGTVNFTADDTISELFGSGAVDLDDSNLTVTSGEFSGVISGNGNLTKVSPLLVSRGASLSVATLILSGTNTYTGVTQIDGGTITLDGSLASKTINVTPSASLDVTTAGLAANAALTNDGTTSLTLDDTVDTYSGKGTLNGPGKLNATTYTLNDGAKINTKLGSGALITNGLVLLSAASESLNVTINAGSTLTLDGVQLLNAGASLLVDGALTLAGGDQAVAALNGGGIINLNTYQFTVTGGLGSSFTGNINAGSTKIVTDGGTLNLSGGTTTTQTTEVNNGGALNLLNGGTLNTGGTTVEEGSTLLVDSTSHLDSNIITVDGTLIVPNSLSLTYDMLTGSGLVDSQGNVFTNRQGFSVRGFLTFNGDFTNYGTFAPGNSPGLITILGNYTEAATLQAELETTTPVIGHDQVRVGGAVTLLNSSTLVVQTYNGAQPVRGASYQVIADTTGATKSVTGAFGSVLFDADGLAGGGAAVANAAVIFDQATGRVTATGLNAATSTFADLGQGGNQRGAAAALLATATNPVGQNQINTTTTAGALALQLVTANGGSSTNLARFTPEFYGALADYALANELAVTKLLRDRVSTLSSLPGTSSSGFSAYSGVMQQQADTADNVDIDRTDIYVGGDYTTAKKLTAGLIVTQNNGDFSADYGHGDVDGLAADAYLKTSLNPSFDLVGRLGFGSNSYDLRRTTTDIVQAQGSTDSDTYTGSVGLSYVGWTWGELSLAPSADLTYSHASVDGFTESGANDRLSLDGYDASNLIAQVGASLVWSTKFDGRRFSVEFNVGLEQSLMNDEDDQQATLVNSSSTTFSQTFAEDDATRAALGLRLGYDLTEAATIYAGYEGSVSSNSSGNVNAGVRMSF